MALGFGLLVLVVSPTMKIRSSNSRELGRIESCRVVDLSKGEFREGMKLTAEYKM